MTVVSESALGKHFSSDIVGIETRRVVDGRVVLDDSDNDTAIFLDELGGPVSYSSEALDDESLASDTLGSELGRLDEGVSPQELLDAVVDTKASAFGTSSNTTLVDEFTSAAAFSVDVLFTLHLHVSVLNPGHNLLVSAHIRSQAVDTRSDEALLGQLHSVSSGDLLKLVLRVISRLDGDATLSSSEWNIGHREFVGHKGCECHGLLEINARGVTGSSFDRQEVVLVLSSVGSDGLDLAIVSADGEGESNDVVTLADEFKPVFGD